MSVAYYAQPSFTSATRARTQTACKSINSFLLFLSFPTTTSTHNTNPFVPPSADLEVCCCYIERFSSLSGTCYRYSLLSHARICCNNEYFRREEYNDSATQKKVDSFLSFPETKICVVTSLCLEIPFSNFLSSNSTLYFQFNVLAK